MKHPSPGTAPRAKPKARVKTGAAGSTGTAEVMAELKRLADPRVKAGMQRYGIPDDNALGIAVGTLRALGKRLGRDHQLAQALWRSGIYEARLLATFVDDPAEVTAEQMDRWCQDFDSWALCDTACFALFDRTPHALGRARAWAKLKGEFQRRAAFALIASAAAHDKVLDDQAFLGCLPLIQRAARDERNFVKKGVSWALRGVGHRSVALHGAALELAQRLATGADATARWIGKDALRDLQRATVRKKLASPRTKPAARTKGR